MKIAVLTRPRDPLSLLIYQENLTRELSALGVDFTPVSEDGRVPSGCDLLWDPALAMRRLPRVVLRSGEPVIGTMHGVKSFSLPSTELADNWVDRCYLTWLKKALLRDWRKLRPRLISLVAVSQYGAEEVIRAFRLPPHIVRVIHHGVDHGLFRPEGDVQRRRMPYFLHVSGANPIKNVPRLFAAYDTLSKTHRPELIAIIPGYSGRVPHGVHLIRDTVPQATLAAWYRGALALIFPSLRETFGLPILEAMACGCPVITSNATACPEVAGTAVLFVDPRSVTSLSGAMQRMAEDKLLRERLHGQGLIRAQDFTWRRAAEQFLAAARFEAAAGTP